MLTGASLEADSQSCLKIISFAVFSMAYGEARGSLCTVGRVAASQAAGRRFETGQPLQMLCTQTFSPTRIWLAPSSWVTLEGSLGGFVEPELVQGRGPPQSGLDLGPWRG